MFVVLFDSGGKKLLWPLYRQFCDLVDDMSRQLIEYESQLLATSLLQDAESNDWQSTNHFYEVTTQHYCTSHFYEVTTQH